MAETRKIEYRVKAVERYIVTRYHEDADGRSVVVERGTFSSPYIALEVARALGKMDQDAAPSGASIQYPGLLDPNVPQDGQLLEMIENKANYLAGDTLAALQVEAARISNSFALGALREQKAMWETRRSRALSDEAGCVIYESEVRAPTVKP